MDWIAKRMREAQAATPVGEAVASRLEEELAGTMRERALRNAELAALARALIAATDPTTTEDAP
ncbi:MAG: hypothetical protein ACLPTZ_16165 [Beijerinckiaceae bacterium]